MTCRACGSENPLGRKFCGECGAALGGTDAAERPAAAAAVPSPSGDS
jgi:hypothetical protein